MPYISVAAVNPHKLNNLSAFRPTERPFPEASGFQVPVVSVTRFSKPESRFNYSIDAINCPQYNAQVDLSKYFFLLSRPLPDHRLI